MIQESILMYLPPAVVANVDDFVMASISWKVRSDAVAFVLGSESLHDLRWYSVGLASSVGGLRFWYIENTRLIDVSSSFVALHWKFLPSTTWLQARHIAAELYQFVDVALMPWVFWKSLVFLAACIYSFSHRASGPKRTVLVYAEDCDWVSFWPRSLVSGCGLFLPTRFLNAQH